jgi:hypothetical protein
MIETPWKEVKIPFLERFREPMLNDQKTMTSRTKIYGAAGNMFYAFGELFRIDEVQCQPFNVIVAQWQAEGCSSKEDFLTVWKQIHPRHTPDAMELFFVHRFHRVGSRRA